MLRTCKVSRYSLFSLHDVIMFYSSKHGALTMCWFNVGPPSATLGQHWTNTWSMPRDCWDEAGGYSTGLTGSREAPLTAGWLHCMENRNLQIDKRVDEEPYQCSSTPGPGKLTTSCTRRGGGENPLKWWILHTWADLPQQFWISRKQDSPPSGMTSNLPRKAERQ